MNQDYVRVLRQNLLFRDHYAAAAGYILLCYIYAACYVYGIVATPSFSDLRYATTTRDTIDLGLLAFGYFGGDLSYILDLLSSIRI